MENELIIFIIALIVLVYGFFSKKLEHLNLSGPMVFLPIGTLLSPLGLNLIHIALDSDVLKMVAEIALQI